ncbi:hypothetical protein KW798_01320 [Candidatus Parcubacteria bacterium]|nr:hypothetical protein [Candidatus Parcubacteria bacterium]
MLYIREEFLNKLKAKAMPDKPIDLSPPRGVTGTELAQRKLTKQELFRARYPDASALFPGHPGDALKPTIANVKRVIRQFFRVRDGDLCSDERAPKVLWSRYTAFWILRVCTTLSRHRIGAHFGGKDPSVVQNAEARVAHRISTDPEYAVQVEQLLRLFKKEH